MHKPMLAGRAKTNSGGGVRTRFAFFFLSQNGLRALHRGRGRHGAFAVLGLHVQRRLAGLPGAEPGQHQAGGAPAGSPSMARRKKASGL